MEWFERPISIDERKYAVWYCINAINHLFSLKLAKCSLEMSHSPTASSIKYAIMP